jgi:mRNA interferase RelE/StbE
LSYHVFLHPKAAISLQKLPDSIGKRIHDSLKEFEDNQEKGERLTGHRFWRLGIGNYRAIYQIDKGQSKIIVLYIGHRKNVYDDFEKLL